MKDHRYFMDAALTEAAQAAAAGDAPVGAVVVQDNAIISRAHNCKEAFNDPCGHAELIALRAAAQVLGRWRLNDCTLYVTLEPCPMCCGAILQARLHTLVFGAFEPRWGAVSSRGDLLRPGRFNHKVEVINGIRERECRQLAEDFFQQIREKPL